MSLLLIVHVALSPLASVTLDPSTAEPPLTTQLQLLAVYPLGPVSLRAYVPAVTTAPVTAVLPVAPLIVTGPVAERVQSVATAVPPLSFVTVFTRVSVVGAVIAAAESERSWLPPVVQSTVGSAGLRHAPIKRVWYGEPEMPPAEFGVPPLSVPHSKRLAMCPPHEMTKLFEVASRVSWMRVEVTSPVRSCWPSGG